ncbi:MAG: hypothetical protein R2697_19170 [Ilumatobacteraceae bacterium]
MKATASRQQPPAGPDWARSDGPVSPSTMPNANACAAARLPEDVRRDPRREVGRARSALAALARAPAVGRHRRLDRRPSGRGRTRDSRTACPETVPGAHGPSAPATAELVDDVRAAARSAELDDAEAVEVLESRFGRTIGDLANLTTARKRTAAEMLRVIANKPEGAT